MFVVDTSIDDKDKNIRKSRANLLDSPNSEEYSMEKIGLLYLFQILRQVSGVFFYTEDMLGKGTLFVGSLCL